MNWKKRGLALGLIAALLCGMLVTASAATGSFSDIQDTETAENVEVLQMMNIINGVTYNSFQPEGTLTRAQFTKMAVMALGRGDEVASYQNFTIFPDVRSSHWASGYINLAVRGETKFIAGFSDGSFGPEQAITFGQSVTILMRLLGYTDQDVGMIWPTGYLNAAASAGLTSGVSVDATSGLTRAQAAKLFVNLLSCKTKDGEKTFAALVANTVEEDVILLDAAAKADDGSAAIETTEGIHKLENGHAPHLLQGRRGDLLLNAKGDVWGFVPSKVGSFKNVTVSTAKSGKITDTEGKEYDITAETVAYYDGEKKKYGEIFINLRSGTIVTLHFGITGKVETVVVGSSAVETAIVIGKNSAAARLDAITDGRKDYEIIRQGEVVTAAQLRENDVVTFHPTEGRAYVSTLRLTGYYQSAWPNAEAPTTIRFLGEDFTVLSSAIPTISKFKVGDKMTVLLTHDFQIAGAAEPQKLSGNGIGIAAVNGKKATVELLEGLTVSGEITSTNGSSYDGLLVSVSSHQSDQISITPVRENTRRGNLDVAARKYGDYELAAGIKLIERVGSSAMKEIKLDDIRLKTVLAAQIQYSRINDQGKVDVLILDNVSGDCFLYGMARTVKVETPVYTTVIEKDKDGKDIEVERETGTYVRRELYLRNGGDELGPFSFDQYQTGQWVGIAVNNTGTRVVSSVKLKELRNVTNENFIDEETVEVGGVTYDVSEEIVCYNRTTALWGTLSAARAFGGDMTLYVDDFNVVRGVQVG